MLQGFKRRLQEGKERQAIRAQVIAGGVVV